MHRVLLISNARAGSVSERTKQVIVKALSADFKLEVADTARRDHASELARDAALDGYDAVFVFGGDGTINETAQGVVGTGVALGVLPGGSTNVLARSLGVPSDPVDATEFMASRLRSGTKRTINVGRIGERYFLFSAGMGLDAEVVKRVEAAAVTMRKGREWLFLRKALAAALTEYRGAPARIEMVVDGEPVGSAVFAICCNARPFTYFKRWPVDALPEARLDGGLDILGVGRVRVATVPRIAWAVLVSRSHTRWKTTSYRHDARSALWTADGPMPVQVDGDYIGEQTSASLQLVPSGLDLLV